MSHHRFSNLHNLFQRDLNKKLTSDLVSLNFIPQSCNCNKATKVNEKCFCEGRCRETIVIYEATCKTCKKSYIGNTQQHLKTRMGQHFQEVRKYIRTKVRSVTFAHHLGSHKDIDNMSLNEHKAVTVAKIRPMVSIKVLWRGNALLCMKSFHTHSCILCMKERTTILHRHNLDPTKLINLRNKIYCACRHKSRFHRYCVPTSPLSTDDDIMSERNESLDDDEEWKQEDQANRILTDSLTVGFSGLQISCSFQTVVV